MRQSLLVAAAASTMLVAALGGTASARPAFVADASNGYIVVLNDVAAPAKVASDHATKFGADVDHLYRAALKGYSAHMSASAAARVAGDSRVLFVQRDGVVHPRRRPPPPESIAPTPN